uniref:Tensin 2 n=1 Tax=Taeniopygia guttata TaxID=59729 RepID=A0A674HLD7_TAEGU
MRRSERVGSSLDSAPQRSTLPRTPRAPSPEAAPPPQLDLAFVTERILSVALPGGGGEGHLRHLRHLAGLLGARHGPNYTIFNLSEKRRDLTRLNPKVLDFGWPELLAPPLELLCSICKALEGCLGGHPRNVAVLLCKGSKAPVGVVVGAFLHYSDVWGSPEQALNALSMRRFCEEKLGGVLQPSQRRYTEDFGELLSGRLRLNSSPQFLHHVLLPPLPAYEPPDGCRPFLKIYQSLQLVYTSGVYSPPASQSLCVTLEPALLLKGDVMVRCYHRRREGREAVFGVQFHTGTLRGPRLRLRRDELDLAWQDQRFPRDAAVEFIFSSGPERVEGWLPPRSPPATPIDYGVQDPAVRRDSYEGHWDSPEEPSHTWGPLDGSPYARVQKKGGPSPPAGDPDSPPPPGAPHGRPPPPTAAERRELEQLLGGFGVRGGRETPGPGEEPCDTPEPPGTATAYGTPEPLGTAAPYGNPPSYSTPIFHETPGSHEIPPSHGMPMSYGTPISHKTPLSHGTPQFHGTPAPHSPPTSCGTLTPHSFPTSCAVPKSQGSPTPYDTSKPYRTLVPHETLTPHGPPASQGSPTSYGTLAPHGLSVSPGTPISHGLTVPYGTPISHRTPISQGSPTFHGTSISQDTLVPNSTPISQGTLTFQGSPVPYSPPASHGTPASLETLTPYGTPTSQGSSSPYGTPKSYGTPPSHGSPTPQGSHTPQSPPPAQKSLMSYSPPMSHRTPIIHETLTPYGTPTSQETPDPHSPPASYRPPKPHGTPASPGVPISHITPISEGLPAPHGTPMSHGPPAAQSPPGAHGTPSLHSPPASHGIPISPSPPAAHSLPVSPSPPGPWAPPSPWAPPCPPPVPPSQPGLPPRHPKTGGAALAVRGVPSVGRLRAPSGGGVPAFGGAPAPLPVPGLPRLGGHLPAPHPPHLWRAWLGRPPGAASGAPKLSPLRPPRAGTGERPPSRKGGLRAPRYGGAPGADRAAQPHRGDALAGPPPRPLPRQRHPRLPPAPAAAPAREAAPPGPGGTPGPLLTPAQPGGAPGTDPPRGHLRAGHHQVLVQTGAVPGGSRGAAQGGPSRLLPRPPQQQLPGGVRAGAQGGGPAPPRHPQSGGPPGAAGPALPDRDGPAGRQNSGVPRGALLWEPPSAGAAAFHHPDLTAVHPPHPPRRAAGGAPGPPRTPQCQHGRSPPEAGGSLLGAVPGLGGDRGADRAPGRGQGRGVPPGGGPECGGVRRAPPQPRALQGVSAGDHPDGPAAQTLFPPALPREQRHPLRHRPAGAQVGEPRWDHGQDFRVRGEAGGGPGRGQHVPCVRGAGPRAAGRGHRHLRHQSPAGDEALRDSGDPPAPQKPPGDPQSSLKQRGLRGTLKIQWDSPHSSPRSCWGHDTEGPSEPPGTSKTIWGRPNRAGVSRAKGGTRGHTQPTPPP